jgi:hypothetical protein
MSYLRSPQARSSVALRALLSCALLIGLVGCDTDSPTAPEQTPTPPPGPVTASFRVTVTANPTQVEAGGNPSTITVTVVRADTNQPPPDLTTVVVSTTLGSLGSANSGIQNASVQLVNGSAQFQLFPDAAAGTAVVRAQIQQSAGQTSVQINEAVVEEPDRFFLEAISPTSGHPNGGDLMRITGEGFLEPVRVFIGSALAEVLNVTPTLIRARIPAVALPAGQTLAVDVSVTNDLNGATQATDTLPGVFTYTRGGGGGGPLQPLVFSVTPSHGPNEGGTQVVVEGDGFESPVQVLFGTGATPAAFTGVEAQIVSVTRTRIVARSPAATAFGQINLNEEIDILVRNLGSGSATIFTNAFRYGVDVLITAISPSEGPFTGGTRVTLFGQGFDEPVAVELAGFGQQIISVTGTEIIVRTVAIDPPSCQDISDVSEVTNIETGDGNTGPGFTYRVEAFGPLVSGVSPSSGTANTNVTLTGSGFVQPLEVVFATEAGGEANATILSVASPNQMTVRVPFFPNTAFETEACDDNGDGTEGTRLIDTPASITVTNLVTTCADTFERAFTITAPSAVCQNDVGTPPDPGDPPEASFEFTIINAATRTVQFTDTSSGTPTQWAWDFQNDGTFDSAIQFPQFSYPADGTFVVLLRVTNTAGSDSTVETITFPPP